MTVEDMRELKKILGLTNRKIALKTGVPLGTVQKIFSGETKNPGYKTMSVLENLFLAEKERTEFYRPRHGNSGGRYEALDHYNAEKYSGAGGKVDFYSSNPAGTALVREGSAGYESGTSPKKEPLAGVSGTGLAMNNDGARTAGQKPGPFRIEDFLKQPEGSLMELIDGFFFQLGTPGIRHQDIAAEVFRQIANHIREHHGTCHPFIAPTGVQLDPADDTNVFIPDVFIVCDHSKVKEELIVGAPDFILEVVSPGTAKRDAGIKLKKYEAAGVREYWMIDPKKNYLVIRILGGDGTFDYPEIVPLKGKVPLGIYGGKLQIDFDLLSRPW